MSSNRFLESPQLMRRGAKERDVVALLPASLLPLKARWQSLANTLPQGGVLVVLAGASRQRVILEQVAEELRKMGRGVTTISAEADELDEER